MDLTKNNFIGYAYGPIWGNWPTYFHPIALGFTDSFTTTDSWTTNAGTWGLSSGAYNQSSTTTVTGYSTITGRVFGSTTYEMDAKLTTTDNLNWVAMNFAKTNAADFYGTSGYMVFLRGNGNVDLFKAGNGVVVGDTATGTDPTSGFVHIKVVKAGTNIKVYVGGATTPQINWTDGGTSFNSGYFSLVNVYSNAFFDNVSIQ
jgi:hypothetical protein